MKKIFKKLNKTMLLFGFDLLKTIKSIRGFPIFGVEFYYFAKQHKKCVDNKFPIVKLYPCLSDRFEEGGIVRGHYFHQDLLVARRIYLNSPNRHIDIGSRIDGFVAHVASYRNIEVIDIRYSTSKLPNIKFLQLDMTKPITKELYSCCDSLSCLHALEHFGLGRYGDPINYNGHIKGLENLYNMLKKSGKLYLSVPIGPLRIEFNAHRVFSLSYLIDFFAGKYSVDQFSYVDDLGELHEDIKILDRDIKSNYGCNYGCGIFEMTKL